MLISRDSNFAAGMLMVLTMIFLIIFGAPAIVFHEDARAPSLIFFILFTVVTGSMILGLLTDEDHAVSKRTATIFLFVTTFLGVLIEHAMHEEWIGRELRRLQRNEKTIRKELHKIERYCKEKSSSLNAKKRNFLTKWLIRRRMRKQAKRGMVLIKRVSAMCKDNMALTSDVVSEDYRTTYELFLKILKK